MADEQKNRSNYPVVALFPVLFLLYILSIGPVGAFTKNNKISRPALKILRCAYAPLTWLHAHTILEKPLDAYTGLWGF